MIRAFFRWMGEVLPPAWVIVIGVGFWLAIEAMYVWMWWWLRVPEVAERYLRLQALPVGVMCVLYGVCRVLAFHPLFDPAYRQWLELTPWTSRKRLPFGPIHLVPQDIIVLAVAILMLYGSPMRLVIAPAALLGGYLVILCLSLMLTDVWKVGYALAFGLGLVVRLGNWPVVSVCLLAGLYPLAYFGLRESLARFPWKTLDWEKTTIVVAKPKSAGSSKLKLGWPYDHLQFNLPARRVPRQHAILLSLLIGWCVYAVACVFPDPEGREVIPSMALVLTSLGCVLGRLVAYCAGHSSPISLWGRIGTGRWFIPGYDQVFVAPLCVGLAAVAAPAARFSLGLPTEIVFPIALSLVLLITLNVGPTFRRWELTGDHRVGPGPSPTEFCRL